MLGAVAGGPSRPKVKSCAQTQPLILPELQLGVSGWVLLSCYRFNGF
jgi:hypothetical protein